ISSHPCPGPERGARRLRLRSYERAQVGMRTGYGQWPGSGETSRSFKRKGEAMRGRGYRIATVVLVYFALVSSVRGDLGPPIIIKFPTMRFDNLADYPDFDFFLKYGFGNGNPYASPHLIPIRSGEAFRLEGGPRRRTEIVLLAVPRGRQPPSLKDGPDWLTET